jgi:hypothetical protein
MSEQREKLHSALTLRIVQHNEVLEKRASSLRVENDRLIASNKLLMYSLAQAQKPPTCSAKRDTYSLENFYIQDFPLSESELAHANGLLVFLANAARDGYTGSCWIPAVYDDGCHNAFGIILNVLVVLCKAFPGVVSSTFTRERGGWNIYFIDKTL